MPSEPGSSVQENEIRKAYSRIPEQTDEQLREIIANTYGQIALIDHNVGRLLEALAKTGLAEKTMVVYTSDHGDWLGDHGLILKGPMHYERLLRVPRCSCVAPVCHRGRWWPIRSPPLTSEQPSLIMLA